MVKCNAIKANGDPCTLQAKYGQPGAVGPTVCRHHRDVSIEAVLDQLQELMTRVDAITNTQQELMSNVHELQERIDAIANSQQEITNHVNTLFTRITSQIPFINRFF